MRRIEGEVDEEGLSGLRLGGVFADVVHGVPRDFREDVDRLEGEAGRAGARVSVLLATCGHVEGFVDSGKLRHAAILDEGVGHHVEGRCDSKIVVEANLERTPTDRLGEIHIPAVGPLFNFVHEGWRVRMPLPVEPEVPFAETGGVVALTLEEGRDRGTAGLYQVGAHPALHSAFEAGTPVVAARHKAVAGRCADGAAGVGVGEAHALGRKPVHVRGGDFTLGIKAAHVAVAKVVGKDVDKVRPACLGYGVAGERKREEKRPKVEGEFHWGENNGRRGGSG